MKPQWEVTLEDAENNKHVWLLYSERIGMFLVAGYKKYEAITRETGCYVLVDSSAREIKAVMNKDWKPVDKDDALKKFQQDVGRYFNKTA